VISTAAAMRQSSPMLTFHQKRPNPVTYRI
jgi:hypothetical protein